MFFYIFLCMSNLFFALEAKNTNHINSIDDLNNIGFFEWGRDILNSNTKKQEIIDLFKKSRIDEVLREETVNKISPWVVGMWLHGKPEQINKDIAFAYADFRDSLSDEQLSRLNRKLYVFAAQLVTPIIAAYAALVGFAVYAELKAQEAQKKFSFSSAKE